jgi:hypothetical protein
MESVPHLHEVPRPVPLGPIVLLKCATRRSGAESSISCISCTSPKTSAASPPQPVGSPGPCYFARALDGDSAAEPLAPPAPRIHVDRGHPCDRRFGYWIASARRPRTGCKGPRCPGSTGLVTVGLVNDTTDLVIPEYSAVHPPPPVNLDLWPNGNGASRRAIPGSVICTARVTVDPPPLTRPKRYRQVPQGRIHPGRS